MRSYAIKMVSTFHRMVELFGWEDSLVPIFNFINDCVIKMFLVTFFFACFATSFLL